MANLVNQLDYIALISFNKNKNRVCNFSAVYWQNVYLHSRQNIFVPIRSCTTEPALMTYLPLTVASITQSLLWITLIIHDFTNTYISTVLLVLPEFLYTIAAHQIGCLNAYYYFTSNVYRVLKKSDILPTYSSTHL